MSQYLHLKIVLIKINSLLTNAQLRNCKFGKLFCKILFFYFLTMSKMHQYIHGAFYIVLCQCFIIKSIPLERKPKSVKFQPTLSLLP